MLSPSLTPGRRVRVSDAPEPSDMSPLGNKRAKEDQAAVETHGSDPGPLVFTHAGFQGDGNTVCLSWLECTHRTLRPVENKHRQERFCSAWLLPPR